MFIPGNRKISRSDFIRFSLIGIGGIMYLTGGLKKASAMIGRISQKQNDDPLMEAKYYVKTERGYECKLCPNFCILKEDKLSSCRTRKASGGKLNTLAYGNPCSVHIDPIEKKPLYHFLPKSKSFSIAIAGCNLHCLNCQNYSISQASPDETRNYSITPEQLIKKAKEGECDSIAYTYTEPIAFYEYTFDSAVIARQNGVKNVFISAGYINEKPLRAMAKYLDAANIDLKSFSDDTYKKLNAGSLQPVLDTLKILHEEGVWLEITCLIVPEWNDDMDEIKEMCDWLVKNDLQDYPLHFSRFYPMYKLTQLPPTPVDTLNKARDIAMKAGVKFVYIGNVPGSDASNTYCPECKKLLVERRGYFITKNNISDNKCPYCSEKIAGIWK